MRQRSSYQWIAALAAAAAWACKSNDVGVASATVASASSSDSVGSNSSSSGSTSQATQGPTEATTTSDTCSDALCTGGPGPGDECSMFVQDCPPGYKCALYSKGSSPDGSHCVPLPQDPKQVGEDCAGMGWGGRDLDDCDLGLVCMLINGGDAHTCRPLCVGEPPVTACPASGWDCIAYGELAGVCMQRCDLLAQDCPDGQTCVPTVDGLSNRLDVWCYPDLAQLAPPPVDGTPCPCGTACGGGDLSCGVGRGCFDGMGGLLPNCQESCCSSFCDANAPNTCELAGQGAECVSFIDSGFEPPIGMEHVGFCRLP